MAIKLLALEWPLPANVGAAITLRGGGASAAPYASANMGSHVGDSEAAVAANRAALAAQLQLPAEPLWLNQVHSSRVVSADHWQPGISADGSHSDRPGQVCTVMGADCLPLLLCNRDGSQVAAVHVGWRGLAAGVVEQALAEFAPGPLLAYLGPAIGAAHFEVGEEVCAALASGPTSALAAASFVPLGSGKYLIDMVKLVTMRLTQGGDVAIYGGSLETYGEPARCFSYRRDGTTGRHAALIWIKRPAAP